MRPRSGRLQGYTRQDPRERILNLAAGEISLAGKAVQLTRDPRVRRHGVGASELHGWRTEGAPHTGMDRRGSHKP
jgi:hypothetical protein